MAHAFDPGYTSQPFIELCRTYPGPEVYPPEDFRVEWGPIFHRGRLDGTARVVVLGQDPGAQESIVRRILVGEAGRRAQGFLAKLGITSSYVMVNAFLYSVSSQAAGERHKDDAAIAAYRNRWLDALLVDTRVEAVVAFGRLADRAFKAWKATPAGQRVPVAYAHAMHPTAPRSPGQEQVLLANWNRALQRLVPHVRHPDVDTGGPVPYDRVFTPEERPPIPEADLPAGIPAWMGQMDRWGQRVGVTSDEKRATLVVTVPEAARLW